MNKSSSQLIDNFKKVVPLFLKGDGAKIMKEMLEMDDLFAKRTYFFFTNQFDLFQAQSSGIELIFRRNKFHGG